MTLDEFLKEFPKTNKDHPWFWEKYIDDNDSKHFRELVVAYAREKCREQREMCAKNANAVAEAGGYVYIDHESLLNAPEPKFD